jgi:hypothetical protein
MTKMYSHTKKIFFLAALFLVASFFFRIHAAQANTASLYFKTPAENVGVGDEFSIDLMLDSGGETVNTIGGDLVFSDQTIQLERVLSNNSVVTSWIQSPAISGSSVTFSGIMPGGYESVINPVDNSRLPGQILTLVFKAVSAGSATITFSDSHLYLNDGLGTETGVVALPYTISIVAHGTGATAPLDDTIMPEPFTPIVSSSPDLFNGGYTLFFSTTDKGSGIDHYEVSEGSKNWVRAESPYLLTDQSLRSTIRVKATDLAGNYRIEQIGSAFAFPKTLLLIPVTLIVLFLIFLFIFYKRKMRRFKKHDHSHHHHA